MVAFNHVTLLGYVGNEIALRSSAKSNYLQVSLGVTKSYKLELRDGDSGNKWHTKTKYYRIMFFGAYAEFAAERLKKGMLVHITGELDISEWKKDGDKRYDMYVLGKQIVPIGPRTKKKADDNYGVPENEINEDNTPF
jgi:single stranded DNA-binding protein